MYYYYFTTYKGGKKRYEGQTGIFRAIWRVQYARSEVLDHSTRWDMSLRYYKKELVLLVTNGLKMCITDIQVLHF